MLAVAEETRESTSGPEGRSQLPPKPSQLLLDKGSSSGESTTTVEEQKQVSHKSNRGRSAQCSGICASPLDVNSTVLYRLAASHAQHGRDLVLKGNVRAMPKVRNSSGSAVEFEVSPWQSKKRKVRVADQKQQEATVPHGRNGLAQDQREKVREHLQESLDSQRRSWKLLR